MVFAMEEALQAVTRPASADLSASQYLAVKLASDGQIELCGAGEAAFGILQDKPEAEGRASKVGIGGISVAIAGAAVAPGDRVTPNAAGKLVGATSGDWVCGEVVVGAGADGEHCSVKLLTPVQV